MNLRLRDAVDVVLDRILERQDIFVLAVHFVQHRVKRRRLAGTSRTGDENQPVRLLDGFSYEFEISLREAHLIERHWPFRLVENSHHYFLAVVSRESRNAQVDFLAAAVELGREAAVLRLSLLVETHIGKNFYSRHYRGVYFHWKHE